MPDRPSLFDAPVDADPSFDRSRGSPTSAASWQAKLADGSADGDRAQVLKLVQRAGSYGLTCDEACIILNRTMNQLSGRFSELWRPEHGRMLIAPNGKRRKTQAGGSAAVYVAR
jgi:hypothetical protein